MSELHSMLLTPAFLCGFGRPLICRIFPPMKAKKATTKTESQTSSRILNGPVWVFLVGGTSALEWCWSWSPTSSTSSTTTRSAGSVSTPLRLPWWEEWCRWLCSGSSSCSERENKGNSMIQKVIIILKCSLKTESMKKRSICPSPW